MNVLPSAPEYDGTQTQQPQQQTLYPTHELAQLSAEDFRLKKINDLLKELSDEAEHYRQVAKKYKSHTLHRAPVSGWPWLSFSRDCHQAPWPQP